MNQENRVINTEGLKPWKPGESGNPLGRPKKKFSLTDGMRKFLNCKDKTEKQKRKDILISQTYKQAIRGDIAAIKLIFNYLEGMPVGTSGDTNIDKAIILPILGGRSINVCPKCGESLES